MFCTSSRPLRMTCMGTTMLKPKPCHSSVGLRLMSKQFWLMGYHLNNCVISFEMQGDTISCRCTNPAYWGCERSGAGGNIVNPVMSARLRTVNSFSFTYGKIEVKAKLPAGDWLWPGKYLWHSNLHSCIKHFAFNNELLTSIGSYLGTPS